MGNEHYSAQGFRPGADDAVFFAEDFATAEHFSLESSAKYPPGSMTPRSFTVIELKMPKQLASEMGLLERGVIGEFRGLPAIQPGASPYERVLVGSSIDQFNRALRQGAIRIRRLKVR